MRMTIIVFATFLSLSVGIDYTLTLMFSKGIDEIFRHEYSPIVVLAVKNNVLLYYLIALMVLYFVSAYLALKVLEPYKIFPIALACVLLIGITHILGGLSWVVRYNVISGTAIVLPLITLGIAIAGLYYTLVERVYSK